VYIQLVTFKLSGPTEEQYSQACREELSTFAGLPGLLSKVWLRDTETNTYGGLYLWRDRASYEAYVEGDIFKSIRDDPSFEGVESRAFDHFEDMTKATQPGLVLV
jgi:heme-degrading monooxygenase HmoA